MHPPATSLFREAALEHQRQRLHGAVLLPQRPLGSPSSLLVCCLVMGGALLLWCCKVPRQERVKGHLVPQNGVNHVVAPQAAVISRIEVEEGQHVVRGQRLVALGPPVNASDGRPRSSDVISSIEERAALVQRRLELAAEQGRARTQSLQRVLGAQRDEVAVYERMIELQRERITLAAQAVSRTQALQREQIGTELDLEVARAELLEQRTREQTLQQLLTASRRAVEDVRRQLEEAPVVAASEEAALRGQRAQLDAMRVDVLQQEGAALVSTVDGVVTAVNVTSGQNVAPGQPLLSVLASGSRLDAQLFVPTSAAGFVAVGVPVKLRVDAFSHRHFGVLNGAVERVTQTVLLPDELPAFLGDIGPAYRVSLPMQAEPKDVRGEPLALRPGMTLSADLVLERRRIIEWLLEPILKEWGFD